MSVMVSVEPDFDLRASHLRLDSVRAEARSRNFPMLWAVDSWHFSGRPGWSVAPVVVLTDYVGLPRVVGGYRVGPATVFLQS